MAGNFKDYGKRAHGKASDYGRRAQQRSRQKSYRKTIGIIVGMLVVLVVAGVAIPHVLPQGLRADQALVGRGGGLSVLSLSSGKGKQILAPPPRNEAFTTWALSQDRSMFLVAWCHENKAGDPASADRMELQLYSSYSGGRRWEYPLDAHQVSMADLQLGYIPGTRDIWLLSRGRLWIMDDQTGATRAVSAQPEGLLLTRVAFSSDGRTVAYSGAASGGALVLAVSDFDGSKISNPEFLNPPIPPGAGTPPMLDTSNWVGRDILALSMLSKNEIAVAQRSADTTRAIGQGQYFISIARVTRDANERWVDVPAEGPILSMSAAPDRKSLIIWVSGNDTQYLSFVQAGTGQPSSAAANPSRKVEVDASQGWRAPAAWSAL